MANDPSGEYHDFKPDAELGEILNGEKTGRDNDKQFIYFNAVGAGVLDMMLVYNCFEKAKQESKGQTLVFWEGDE